MVVINRDDEYIQKIANIDDEHVVLIEGGEERANSVSNALRYLQDSGLPDSTPVMVHDAARPCITQCDLKKLYTSFKKNEKACLLAAPLVDTIQKIDQNRP